ncbi:transmembrane protein 33-containing Krueppel homolog 2 [Oratosquilla oratoria]|uniref:transmembrane protein 33-containing Krueppel homolog 2 n=1 Tax=Oratosquilla oratoria TaxID=337810 RepID=UPI003F75C54B
MEGEGQQQQQQQHQQEQQQSGTTRVGGIQGLKNHVMANLVDTALWATRLLTLVFCLLYLLPIVGNSASSYQKALMSNAATSALRLHQRIPSVQFSREFLAQLLLEDSAHYLLYSVVFMYTSPITMVLVPVFLFALLHFASYSLALLDVLGQNNALASRFLISLVEYQQRNILRGAAFVEIFLMPLVVVSLFLGRVTLLTPFLYYRFLFLRYSSRRNPYTRTMFYELRISAEYAINKPGVPSFLRNGVLRAISFLSGIAPVVQPQ